MSASSSSLRPSSPKGRRFYVRPSSASLASAEGASRSGGGGEAVARSVRESVLGARADFSGPFGRRRVVYCDHVASGRAVGFVEDFLRAEVLPLYGNTHTTTTITSLQTTHFRDEARQIVRNAVNASEEDAVIFVGSGATGAVHKLVQALKPRIDSSRRVVVLAGAMEHHSNLLPWRDLGGDKVSVETVPEDEVGRMDEEWLEKRLGQIRREGENTLVIGVFCAASNVTGILNDDLSLTALLHSHGALALWDYATAAPYVRIDANPRVAASSEVDPALLAKDAVFFSSHKFVGGVQAPGVLVAKKKLFLNQVPNGGGGGSVFFVSPRGHRYLKDVEIREEGGTPPIVETIRAGLAVQLKEAVGSGYIMKREEQLWARARRMLETECPNIVLLGNPDLSRLPVISFAVRHPQSGAFLHHNFVCAALNDLFGLQARGGCACAGPYAQALLGIDEKLASSYESLLAEDDRLDRHHLRRGHAEYSSYEILRPGFSRLNLPWYATDAEVDFILDSLCLFAKEGWKLLPQYRLNNETGEWKHHTNLEYRERKWLGNISYGPDGKFSFTDKYSLPPREDEEDHQVYSSVLSAAEAVLSDCKKEAARQRLPDQTLAFDGEAARLRWFLLPSEASAVLIGEAASSEFKPPFKPKTYKTGNANINTRPGSYHSECSLTLSAALKRALGQRGAGRATSVGAPWLEVSCSEEDAVAKASGKEKSVTENGNKEQQDPLKDSPEEAAGDCPDGMCLPRKPEEEAAPVTENGESPSPKPSVHRWMPPTKDIFRPFLEGVKEFSMIQNGDRVLVCLSGGKDSLSLLHTLRQYQFVAAKEGVKFDLGALTVDPRSSGYDPRPLIPYLAALGVPYLYEEQDIMAQALEAECSSICAFCSRMKRGRIYAAARREGYNVLAMGQHLDDLAESFLMSVFHNGRIRTMKANYTVKEGDLRVIRPLCFVRERLLRDFASSRRLPVIAENCPACFSAPKERHRTKQLLAQQELLFPRLYQSLRAAMMPAMSVGRTGLESRIFGKGSKEITDQDEDEDEEEDGA